MSVFHILSRRPWALRLLGLSALTLACGAASAADLDKLRLRDAGEVYRLAPFDASAGRQYAGSFRGPYGFGGTVVHLFPNGRFAVVKTSDISLDVVCRTGSYQLDGTALAFKDIKIHTDCSLSAKDLKGLRMVWGDIQKEGYITGFEVFLFTADEWVKLNAGDKGVSHMKRMREYPDWQEIQRDYESK